MKIVIELGPKTIEALAELLKKPAVPKPTSPARPKTGAKPGPKPGEYRPRDKQVAIKNVAAHLHISSPTVRQYAAELGIKERPVKNYLLRDDAISLVKMYEAEHAR